MLEKFQLLRGEKKKKDKTAAQAPDTQAMTLLQHFTTALVAQTENEILVLNFRAPSNPEPRTPSSAAPLFDSALPAQGLQQDEMGTRDRTLQLTNPPPRSFTCKRQ